MTPNALFCAFCNMVFNFFGAKKKFNLQLLLCIGVIASDVEENTFIQQCDATVEKTEFSRENALSLLDEAMKSVVVDDLEKSEEEQIDEGM